MAKKKSLGDYTALGSKGAELVLQNLPFVLFLGFLAIIYIANAHYAEKRVREVFELQKEVKDLRREYHSLRADIAFNSRRTELARQLKEKGLGQSIHRQIKVEVPEQ
jgi:type III secretory pathway component EscU